MGTSHSHWLILCVGVGTTDNWLSYGPVTPHSLSCLFVILSLNIITMIAAILLVSGAASLVSTGPTIYKLDEERNIAESILTPVSSTGINNMKTS